LSARHAGSRLTAGLIPAVFVSGGCAVRIALIVVNLFVAAASAVVFGWTFFARDHLVGLAEDYGIDRTVRYGTPAVDQVEKAVEAVLKNPVAAALVPVAVREAIRAEIAAFHRDPHAYVRQLVARGTAVEKGKHPLADKVIAWKEQVKAYFERTLAGVIRDVRIFGGTNVVA